jgi:hypothetical protein
MRLVQIDPQVLGKYSWDGGVFNGRRGNIVIMDCSLDSSRGLERGCMYVCLNRKPYTREGNHS